MTSNAGGSDPIVGSLRSADGNGIVRIEVRYDTDADDLWSALTDTARLASWYGEVEGDLRLGGELHVRITGEWEGTGRVDACEPPRRLLVTMRDADPQPGQPEETVTEAQLTPEGNQTLLVLEERGMPVQLLAPYGVGVQIHVENLAAHIAGRERADAQARWEVLLPAYQDLAASVG